MVTNLDKFKKRMEPARKVYANEIRNFTRKYNALGEMIASEFPDIDVQEYIFEFETVDGTTENELDKIHSEIHQHMREFSKTHGIEHFCQWAGILL